MQPDAAGSEAQHKLVLKHCMDESKDVEGDHNDDVGALETQAKGQQRELGWVPSDASSSTLELSPASPKSKESFEGHRDKIASPTEDVEGDKIDNVGEGPAQTPALKKKRTSLDPHMDEIGSADKKAEGDDNGTESDTLRHGLSVGCAELKNLPPSTKTTLDVGCSL